MGLIAFQLGVKGFRSMELPPTAAPVTLVGIGKIKAGTGSLHRQEELATSTQSSAPAGVQCDVGDVGNFDGFVTRARGMLTEMSAERFDYLGSIGCGSEVSQSNVVLTLGQGWGGDWRIGVVMGETLLTKAVTTIACCRRSAGAPSQRRRGLPGLV